MGDPIQGGTSLIRELETTGLGNQHFAQVDTTLLLPAPTVIQPPEPPKEAVTGQRAQVPLRLNLLASTPPLRTINPYKTTAIVLFPTALACLGAGGALFGIGANASDNLQGDLFTPMGQGGIALMALGGAAFITAFGLVLAGGSKKPQQSK